MSGEDDTLTPAAICRNLLLALEVSEARRRNRARDTRPDAIGLGIKRDLLTRAVLEAPSAEHFGSWLLAESLRPRPEAASGAVRAMALEILMEWRLAQSVGSFRTWLDAGARSDDRQAPEA
jgi:hypothetical protein